jgi:Flp pilus assembly pilin Flp
MVSKMETTLRHHLNRFLADERGGAALEFALVSAMAAVVGFAFIGAAQKGLVPLLPDVHRKIMTSIDEINRSLR